MKDQCARCKRVLSYPITVESKDPHGCVRWRVTLCVDCHDDWADSFEFEEEKP